MIVKYFSWIKEHIGKSEEQIDLPICSFIHEKYLTTIIYSLLVSILKNFIILIIYCRPVIKVIIPAIHKRIYEIKPKKSIL